MIWSPLLNWITIQLQEEKELFGTFNESFFLVAVFECPLGVFRRVGDGRKGER